MASALAAVPLADTSYADVLSPSKVSCFQTCGAKFFFRYVLGIHEPKTSNLAVGIAVHDPIAANFRLKMETGKDLPIEDALTEYDAAWAAIEPETAFREDEDPSKLAATGRGLVELYMREMAPNIQPLAVELPVSGVIGGVRVQGVIDLIDQDWTISENKTSARSSRALSPAHRFQLDTYSLLSPRPTRKIQRCELVKNKTPKLVQISETVKDSDYEHLEAMYPLVQEGMISGVYIPNRGSTMCSRRHCGYWRMCENEWGGTVSGGSDE